VKILAVDDEPGVLYTIKQGLETLNETMTVTTAQGGKKCLELLEKESFDLILLDVMMPEMSGWITYDKIRDHEKWNSIPIIFLTARTDQLAQGAGHFMAEDYIQKPVDVVELQQRIEKAHMKNKGKH
jgi:CheY-like chemotaxis protein